MGREWDKDGIGRYGDEVGMRMGMRWDGMGWGGDGMGWGWNGDELEMV